METLPARKDRPRDIIIDVLEVMMRWVMDYCKVGWPQRYQVQNSAVPYWRSERFFDNS